jgi:hypothetical protein
VADPQKAIEEFLHTWNENPKPFVWTATVESIVEKLSRCRQTLEQIQLPITDRLQPRSAWRAKGPNTPPQRPHWRRPAHP